MMKHFLAILIILFCGRISAQHNHGGEAEENEKPVFKRTPKHGGEVIDAGKYKLEIVIDPISVDYKLTVYVLKRNYKEIQAEGVTGNVILKFRNGQIDTVSLINDNGRLYANKINFSSDSNMFFNLKIDNKDVAGNYFNHGLIKNKH